jgi:branched-chain amino acid transport system permease protein
MTTRLAILGWIMLPVGLLLLPQIGLGSERMLLINLILVYSIFAIGYDLSFGLTGMLSLGHAAMFGTGAYVLAYCTIHLQWNFELSLALAGLCGAAVAAFIGFFALRMTGIFFALTTLAFAQLFYILANTKLRAYTGGVDGIAGVPRPALFGIDFYDDRLFYGYLAVIFAVLLVVAALLRSSPFGQILRAINLNDTRIEQLGWNVRHYRHCVFVISGFYSGVSGALLGALLFYVSPQLLHWTTSGDVLIMTILGGVGTLLGPILGVTLFEILKDELGQLTQHWYGLLGLIFVVFTLFLPRGLMGLLSAIRQRTAGRTTS